MCCKGFRRDVAASDARAAVHTESRFTAIHEELPAVVGLARRCEALEELSRQTNEKLLAWCVCLLESSEK